MWPAQIDEEREKELVIKLRNGTLIHKEKMELIEGYIRLAINVTRKHFGNKYHNKIEVLIAEALFSTVKAIEDAATKLVDDNLKLFLIARIRFHVQRFCRVDRVVTMPYSTIREYEKSGKDVIVPGNVELPSNLPTKESSVPLNLMELKDFIAHCVKYPLEREIIKLRSEGYKDHEIAEKLGYSVAYINMTRNKIENRFIEKLKGL